MRHGYDLLVVGGGINGAGVARDAVGRGLSVMLVEAGDLAGETSSASSKLIHGGLRYLEHYAFRLVRESLQERKRLLAIAPHLVSPLRFVMPRGPGSRPDPMIRAGLFLYDHLGGRGALPRSRAIRLDGLALGARLDPSIRKGYAYWDCRVDDARLVVLNACDAAARGARIAVRTRFERAERSAGGWIVHLRTEAGPETVRAGAIVNAAGTHVSATIDRLEGARRENPPRLVQGSHIIVPRLHEGEEALILQNPDGRVIFVIPYQARYSLIGTTDVPWRPDMAPVRISDAETRYLCESVNRYFARGVAPEDVVHAYSGVRSLYDNGAADASSVTRDYHLALDASSGPPCLSVFGGKLTTYRILAEHVLETLKPLLPPMGGPWTGSTPLPGGDVGPDGVEGLVARSAARWPFLAEAHVRRLVRAYGTAVDRVVGDAASAADMGTWFTGDLTEREVDHLVRHEWARTADDILWRRTKCGLACAAEEEEALAAWLGGRKA